MEQGMIVEAEAPTVRVGATPTGLKAPSPPQPPQGFLQAGCPSYRPTNSVKALKDEETPYSHNVLILMKISLYEQS